MAVTLDGGGGLFDRLGRLGHVLNVVNGRRGGGSAGDLPVEVNDVLAGYDGLANEIRAAVATLLSELEGTQTGMSSILFALREAAQTDLVASFHADDPLPEASLEAALDALWRQMRSGTIRYVDPNTLGATVTSTGNTGTGAVAVHTKDGLGVPLEHLLAEDLLITVTDTSTPAAPTLRVRGEAAESDKLHWLWPAGSGVDASYTAIDAADASANLLANGAFDDFTVANTPDYWPIVVGAAGTDILQETSTVYVAGGKALEFLGDGSTLSQVRQNVVAGVTARTPYAINFWARVSAAPSAGELDLDLYDGSNVIDDEAGNPISTTIDLTTIGTTFVSQQLTFSLPEPLPSAVWVRVHLSTALETAKSVFIDHMALAALAQPGQVLGATPYICFFSGSVNWALDDGSGVKIFKVAVANNRASLWQQLVDKFFDCSDLGFTLPTAGDNVIDDNLIG